MYSHRHLEDKKKKILGQLSFLHNENSTSMVCDSAFKDELGSMLASSAELVRLNLLHSSMPVGE